MDLSPFERTTYRKTSLYVYVPGIIIMIISHYALAQSWSEGNIRYVLAILEGVGFCSTLWIYGWYIAKETDAYKRMLFIRGTLIGFGLLITLMVIWGFIENANIVQPIPVLFWVMIWIFTHALGLLISKGIEWCNNGK